MIKKLYIQIASFLISFSMRIINRTLKIKIIGTENLDDNVIFAIWHNSTFALFDINPLKKMAALTADGIKGDIFTKAIERYKYKIIRVPYDENARKSAVSALKTIKALKEGYNFVIALDGPKGPLYEIKSGIFYLAKKSGKKIVPIGAAFSKNISLLYRWDKYKIPFPFSKVCVYLDTNFNGITKESLKEAMLNAQKKAEEMI